MPFTRVGCAALRSRLPWSLSLAQAAPVRATMIAVVRILRWVISNSSYRSIWKGFVDVPTPCAEASTAQHGQGQGASVPK
jgi:hypothetical protein